MVNFGEESIAVAAIEKGFDSPPSVSQVADFLSTSHQNLKQIAVQLDKKGFIQIERDPNDKRRLLLKVTEKNRDYWDSRANDHIAEVNRLFQSLTKKEVDQFHSIIRKLLEGTTEIYEEMR